MTEQEKRSEVHADLVQRLDALHDDWVAETRRMDKAGEYRHLRRAHGDELRHQLARCRSLIDYAYQNTTPAAVRP